METAKMGENAANGVQVTYFVAECMEFLRYGEYVEDIPTIKEALEYYDKIPTDRLNAGKGIGIHIHDPKEGEYAPEYQLLTWQTLDIDSLQLSPFVYIRFSESAGVEERDVLQIEEADPLFGKLDQERVENNRISLLAF